MDATPPAKLGMKDHMLVFTALEKTYGRAGAGCVRTYEGENPMGDVAWPCCQLTSPAAKSSRLVWFRAGELHPKLREPPPDDLRRTSNSREGVLQPEAVWDRARPANAKLGSAPRYLAEAARQRTATGHK